MAWYMPYFVLISSYVQLLINFCGRKKRQGKQEQYRVYSVLRKNESKDHSFSSASQAVSKLNDCVESLVQNGLGQ